MKEETNYYSKISTSVFYGKKEEETSLIKKIGSEKVMLILDYLYNNQNRHGLIHFSLNDMIARCGNTPRTGRGNINEQYKTILRELNDLEIVGFDSIDDFEKINPSCMYRCAILDDLDKHYVLLMETEKELILNHKSVPKTNNAKLLMFYLYLKSRMYKIRKGDYFDVKAQVCYPAYTTIKNDIGLSDESITKYINILVELDLIRVGNAGIYYDKTDKIRTKRESNNVYTLFKTDIDDKEIWHQEIKKSIANYKFHFPNRVFDENGSREYKNNNKSENGKISRITYLEGKGKATVEQIAERDELLEKREIKKREFNEPFEIEAQFEKYPYCNHELLLSKIYSIKRQPELSEKYKEIECILGLVNREFEVQVPYSYYKWIMINYSKDEHEFYYNSIQKKIRDLNNIVS